MRWFSTYSIGFCVMLYQKKSIQIPTSKTKSSMSEFMSENG